MTKKTVCLLLFCFLLGSGSAIALRLFHSSHGSHAPSEELAAEFNLLQQPLTRITAPATPLVDEVNGVNNSADNSADSPGENTTLAQHAAQRDANYLLVNFWATWCAPCLKEMPLLASAAARHGIPVIGISYETPPVIRAFLNAHPVSYDIYKSAFDIFYFFQQQGNRTAVLPYTVLIDRSGGILAAQTGEFTSAAQIVNFVNRHAGQTSPLNSTGSL